MNNFRTIYRYELKKLLGKKLLWAAALLCLLGIAVTACAGLIGTYYEGGEPVESNSAAFLKDRAHRRALSGRRIDQALLEETVHAYARIPSDAAQYTLTEEYEAFARPYSDIFNLIRSYTGMTVAEARGWEADEAALYAVRRQRLESDWTSLFLTQAEIEFWRGQEDRLDAPFLYLYHEGYENMMTCLLTVGVLMLLFVAICMSSLFADEHARRTDQLILSSAKGKATAYWAKLLAGTTVSLTSSLLMSLITAALCLSIYGSEGFDMPLQSDLTTYSYPLTIGQACLIAYAVLVVASILAAVFVMVASELLRSSVAALSLSSGLIILGNTVVLPAQYRVAAQVWDWSPMVYLSIWNIFDSRTLPLFGRCFVSWQVVPVIYILLSVLLALGGKIIYQRYQVSGR